MILLDFTQLLLTAKTFPTYHSDPISVSQFFHFCLHADSACDGTSCYYSLYLLFMHLCMNKLSHFNVINSIPLRIKHQKAAAHH